MGLADKLDQLPNRPRVYHFKGAEGEDIKVGKARVLRDRRSLNKSSASRLPNDSIICYQVIGHR